MNGTEDYNMIYEILLGIGGICLYIVFKAKNHLRDFNFRIFLKENYKYWMWSLLMLFIISAIINLSPTAAEAIKGVTGLDVSLKKGAFLSLGIGLAGMARGMQKKPLRN